MDRSNADLAASFAVPMIAQLFSAPLHILSLDLYSHPKYAPFASACLVCFVKERSCMHASGTLTVSTLFSRWPGSITRDTRRPGPPKPLGSFLHNPNALRPHPHSYSSPFRMRMMEIRKAYMSVASGRVVRAEPLPAGSLLCLCPPN